MLEFTLNSKPFALDRSNSVRLSWINPACNFREFPGDIGMGIEIPVNDINRALLGNPERFERYASENDREFSRFEIRYGGVLLMGGTLIIQTATNESYTAWLRSDVGNIGKEHREKYIYDSVSFLEEKTFDNKANYDPDTDDYACPEIFNCEFFRDKGRKITLKRMELNDEFYDYPEGQPGKKDWEYVEKDYETEDLTEAFRKSASWIINYADVDGEVKASSSEITYPLETIEDDLEIFVVSPMLFLNYIIKTIIKDSGFYLDNNFIADDADLKKLILYNNTDITFMNYIIEVDVTSVEEFQAWIDDITSAIGRPLYRVIRNYTGKFLYKDLIPKIQLKDFILSVQNLLNVFMFFRPGRKIVDIIDRESILTGLAIDVEQYLTGFWEMEEKKDVTLKFTFSHDSNDTFFQERFENLDDRRDDEKEPVEDLAELNNVEDPELGEIRFIRSLNQYYQYSLLEKEAKNLWTDKVEQTNYVGWESISTGFQNGYYNYGKEEEEEIPTKFSSLFGEQKTYSYQKGNIKNLKYAYELFSSRLLFYLGNNTGNYKTENISIDWEKEETGLLETRWKNWARFWATRQPVSCEAHFPLNMIAYVLQNIYRKFRTREGEFIIEEMETEFGINQIGVSKIKGYKLDYGPTAYNLNDVWRIGEILWIDQKIVDDSINPFL